MVLRVGGRKQSSCYYGVLLLLLACCLQSTLATDFPRRNVRVSIVSMYTNNPHCIFPYEGTTEQSTYY